MRGGEWGVHTHMPAYLLDRTYDLYLFVYGRWRIGGGGGHPWLLQSHPRLKTVLPVARRNPPANAETDEFISYEG